MRRHILLTLLFIATAVSLQASTPFISHERPSRFIDVELHALVGGSTVTQNYTSCFPQISEMDLTLGTAVGAGARACILFSDFIGLGCEANILINNYKMSMAVANDDAMSMTTGFIHNHYYTACFPVFITLNFNLGPVVKWNIDGGMYYTYGLSGRSKTTLYSASINELGQLITSSTNEKVSYYNSPETFITSSYRGDLGLHLSTGLTFASHYTLGIQTQIGFKNVAHAYNAIVTPNVHNVNFLCSLGYRF